MKTVFDSIEFAHTPPPPFFLWLGCSVSTVWDASIVSSITVCFYARCVCLIAVWQWLVRVKPFSDGEAKMLYVYCSSHLMMTMIIIHSFHKLSLKPIKALVLLNPQSSVVVSKHICSDWSRVWHWDVQDIMKCFTILHYLHQQWHWATLRLWKLKTRSKMFQINDTIYSNESFKRN